MHHRQQIDAVGHQRRGVVQGDAADRADRQVQFAAGLVEQIEAAGGGTGFGVGVEEAAEGDVTRAFLGRLFGEFELRVSGRTDDGLATEQGAGRGQRAVGLAQVQTNT
jgi:hypothetical protein